MPIVCHTVHARIRGPATRSRVERRRLHPIGARDRTGHRRGVRPRSEDSRARPSRGLAGGRLRAQLVSGDRRGWPSRPAPPSTRSSGSLIAVAPTVGLAAGRLRRPRARRSLSAMTSTRRSRRSRRATVREPSARLIAPLTASAAAPCGPWSSAARRPTHDRRRGPPAGATPGGPGQRQPLGELTALGRALASHGHAPSNSRSESQNHLAALALGRRRHRRLRGRRHRLQEVERSRRLGRIDEAAAVGGRRPAR